MANLKIIIDGPLMDGHRVTFKAPCACTGIDKLDIRYVDGDTQKSKLFTMKDTHGNNLTGLGNLFDEGAYVQAILSLSDNGAYLQNAATNGYLEGKLKNVVDLNSSQALTNKTYNGYTLARACAYDVTDSISSQSIGTNPILPTERDVYHGLPTINGSHSYTSATNIYAPTSVGTKGHILQSNGSGAPVWVSPGKRTHTQVFSGAGTITTTPGDHMYLTFRATVNGNVMTKTVFLGELGLWGSISESLAHGSNSLNVTINANSIVVTSKGASSISGYYMD